MSTPARIVLKARTAGITTTISALFPQRLKKKKAFWSTARSSCKCNWCEDSISEGEKIVIGIENEIYCLQCGYDAINEMIPKS